MKNQNVRFDKVRVTKLHVEKFRQLEDIELPIGEYITLIAGQNGTAKSTILGMICQPFAFGVRRGSSANTPDASKYIGSYHGVNLNEYKTLLGTEYSADCNDVFRLSKKHDYQEEYSYRIHLVGQPIEVEPDLANDGLLVKQRFSKGPRGQKRSRFVTGPGTSHQKGQGNFPHPVIYLGLNRLFPLAQCVDVTGKPKSDLPEAARSWYVQQYADILILRDEYDNDVEHAEIPGRTKHNLLGPVSQSYDTESCSAGQDNLGQILSAILSFSLLKEQLGNRYVGGILLVDEIDTALHPFALEKLTALLVSTSQDLNLQIIATTHSLELLRLAYKSRLKNFISVIPLQKRSGRVSILQGADTYEALVANLKAELLPEKKHEHKKVTVVLEDPVSRVFFFALVGNRIDFEPVCGKKSGNLINQIPTLGLKELSQVLFVPDGDIVDTRKDSKVVPNLVYLPGQACPERLVFEFLYGLDDDDPFWESQARGYSHQVAFKDSGRSPKDSDAYKTWYSSQKKYWKTELSVFKSWADKNKELSAQFCTNFALAIRRSAPGRIPEDAIRKIESRFGT